jgi:hypothetical protein
MSSQETILDDTLYQVCIVTVLEEEGGCIVYLEVRADELMRHLISGELASYRVVRTSPEPLHVWMLHEWQLLLIILGVPEASSSRR